MDITKTKKDGAEVLLSGTLTSKDVEKFFDAAVTEAQKEVSVAGFRKGNVPKERVIEEVGKNFLWKRAAEQALNGKLEGIIKSQEITPIAPLSVSLKDPQHGSDVSFEITVITPPTAKIENYKKVAEDALATLPKTESKKEEEDAQRAFRTQVRLLARPSEGNSPQPGNAQASAINKMSKPDDPIRTDDSKESTSNGAGVKESEVPLEARTKSFVDSNGENEAPAAGTVAEEMNSADEPLTDDEAKLVGLENGKAAEHFIEGEAKKAVADRDMQKRRGAVAEALIKAAIYEIPKVLIDDEARALMETFKRDVKAQGLEWSDYLKRVNKPETEIAKELQPNAEKRIALDLIFARIIREEKFELSDEEKKQKDEFAKKITEQGVDEKRANDYAHEQYLREKVWTTLNVNNK